MFRTELLSSQRGLTVTSHLPRSSLVRANRAVNKPIVANRTPPTWRNHDCSTRDDQLCRPNVLESHFFLGGPDQWRRRIRTRSYCDTSGDFPRIQTFRKYVPLTVQI